MRKEYTYDTDTLPTCADSKYMCNKIREYSDKGYKLHSLVKTSYTAMKPACFILIFEKEEIYDT